MFYLKGNRVQSEVPHITNGVIQGLLYTLQLGGVLLQKPAVVLQLNLCVYFCKMEGESTDREATSSL